MCQWSLPLLVTVVWLWSSGQPILRSGGLLDARAPSLFLAGVDLLVFRSLIPSVDTVARPPFTVDSRIVRKFRSIGWDLLTRASTLCIQDADVPVEPTTGGGLAAIQSLPGLQIGWAVGSARTAEVSMCKSYSVPSLRTRQTYLSYTL
ncbi:hypothetical protein SCHPADRAFT_884933 [Schizopora paradoxa]|uniref:Secreted protein n=1 Tax=Schizopora paradoxa TaxID=27342 RepID=A0A0H2S8D7_9AGAM|nr:hypothetical protein SCHPADRAFT_884933 [Schizopora paradoxa]